MGLITYEGVLLKRNDRLANGLACCCDVCDCCAFDTISIVASQFIYRGNFGITNGNIVANSFRKVSNAGCRSVTDPSGQPCVGKVEFEVFLTNGGCQENATVDGHACLYVKRSADNDNKGNCCYWEIFVEEPEYSECLKDGFPDMNAARPTVPTCTGGDAPSDCQFILPSDPCFGLCSPGGFDSISFTTDSGGNCSCAGDEEFI
jgi:hypothetical protein